MNFATKKKHSWAWIIILWLQIVWDDCTRTCSVTGISTTIQTSHWKKKFFKEMTNTYKSIEAITDRQTYKIIIKNICELVMAIFTKNFETSRVKIWAAKAMYLLSNFTLNFYLIGLLYKDGPKNLKWNYPRITCPTWPKS